MYQLWERWFEAVPKVAEATFRGAMATQMYVAGAMNYVNAFAGPSIPALNSFMLTERRKIGERDPWKNASDYARLLGLNVELGNQILNGSMVAVNELLMRKAGEAFVAWADTFWGDNGNDIASFAAREQMLAEALLSRYPEAIRSVGTEYGLHLENGGYVLCDETDRFLLYQVLPLNPSVQVQNDLKPIVIKPPYVLGPNILSFLPREGRSYLHAFAGQGIPTYLCIPKEIANTVAVQLMTAEDDASDLAQFCRWIVDKHQQKVTLHGFCQGGYHAVVALLSGVLDGLVDTLITCVTPMDGTRTVSLRQYMLSLAERYRDIGYATRVLPNGNKVIDGRIMSWVYKLKSLEKNAPLAIFVGDLCMFDGQANCSVISKSAAAINFWQQFDQTDLPIAVTELSFTMFRNPISENGTLPVRIFGRELNLHRMEEMGIRWLMCVAQKDDLVDWEASVAPLDHISAEVCVFPKGHVAIATSWSNLKTECAVDKLFPPPKGVVIPSRGRRKDGLCRGPVRFQLDLNNFEEAV